jgi:diguanylate cyclase (GGDEF)-like protein
MPDARSIKQVAGFAEPVLILLPLLAVLLVAWPLRAESLVLVIAASVAVLLARRDARKRDQRLASHERAAEVALRRLRLTADQLRDGVMVVDDAGEVVVINEKAIALLELPDRFRQPCQPFSDIADYLAVRDEFSACAETAGHVDAFRPGERGRVRTFADAIAHHDFDRRRPDGTVLRIETRPMLDGGFIRLVTDITAQRRADEKIARLARQDAVTSLLNRAAFRECTAAALGRSGAGRGLTLMVVDIDAFKIVNEAHGQEIADRLLRTIGMRLSASVRASDVVARTGGNEFSIALRGLSDAGVALARARQIAKSMREPFIIADRVILITISIGIVVAPADGDTVDGLLRCADVALRSAKLEGRGSCRLYLPEKERPVALRRQTEIELSRAVLDEQIELLYQPLISVRDGKVAGFEALLRWRHPSRGMIASTGFMPLAEETGLIVPIEQWMLREACQAASRWPGDVRIAINLSTTQFRTQPVADQTREALRASGLAPDRLELAVPEAALLHNAAGTLSQLRELNDLGVRITVDGFGIGYASLTYLSEFAFDHIRVHEGLIAELGCSSEADAIVEAMIAIAGRLGVKVIAGGVERQEQFEILARLGCAEVQGSLFDPPRPAAEIGEARAACGGDNDGMADVAASLGLWRNQNGLAE